MLVGQATFSKIEIWLALVHAKAARQTFLFDYIVELLKTHYPQL